MRERKETQGADNAEVKAYSDISSSVLVSRGQGDVDIKILQEAKQTIAKEIDKEYVRVKGLIDQMKLMLDQSKKPDLDKIKTEVMVDIVKPSTELPGAAEATVRAIAKELGNLLNRLAAINEYQNEIILGKIAPNNVKKVGDNFKKVVDEVNNVRMEADKAESSAEKLQEAGLGTNFTAPKFSGRSDKGVLDKAYESVTNHIQSVLSINEKAKELSGEIKEQRSQDINHASPGKKL